MGSLSFPTDVFVRDSINIIIIIAVVVVIVIVMRATCLVHLIVFIILLILIWQKCEVRYYVLFSCSCSLFLSSQYPVFMQRESVPLFMRVTKFPTRKRMGKIIIVCSVSLLF